MAAQVYRTIM